MRINIRKGLFRLWVVGSILFAVSVGVVSYGGIRDEFRFAHADWDAIYKQYGGGGLLPVKCTPIPVGATLLDKNNEPNKEQRGIAGTDYDYHVSDGLCWYELPNSRRLYPEYHDLNDNKLAELLYEKAGQPLKHFHPWQKLGKVIALVFGVPLAVLVLGWGLLWAFSGFRAA